MSDTTSKEFRKALASAIKYHVESNKLNGVSASKIVGIANSRMSQIIRGDVEKISSDALVDILGKLGYRLDSGATEGHEFTLTLDQGLGLPKDIDPPITYSQEPHTIQPTAAIVDGAISISHTVDEADPDANRVSADE
jgi:predicted XRE-type DNA-binding protein